MKTANLFLAFFSKYPGCDNLPLNMKVAVVDNVASYIKYLLEDNPKGLTTLEDSLNLPGDEDMIFNALLDYMLSFLDKCQGDPFQMLNPQTLAVIDKKVAAGAIAVLAEMVGHYSHRK